jgi:succinate dehydrogenase/fumarate reductase flavoprotein subunit
MQVLPRFVSSGESGGGEREFLQDYLKDSGDLLSRVFLKGYQWPFDTRKLSGSSLIDLLLFVEQWKGRRIYLDFRKNPGERGDIDYGSLSKECRDYLEAAGACFGVPVDRLERMNKPALEFYRDGGAISAGRCWKLPSAPSTHNNGGLGVDRWWRSNVEGLLPVGEAAVTHGVYRPGGSALNAGQVGSLRAALCIAGKSRASAFSFQGLEFTKTLKNFEPQRNLRFENTKAQKEGIQRCFMPPLCALFAVVSFS